MRTTGETREKTIRQGLRKMRDKMGVMRKRHRTRVEYSETRRVTYAYWQVVCLNYFSLLNKSDPIPEVKSTTK
jgi:hypothetical protein